MAKRIEVKDLNIYYGSFHAVESVNLTVEPRTVTAFIGPSGCGKSTVLRTLNRMHEVIPGAYCTGKVELDGVDLYGKGVDPVAVRRNIGMVFQRANPFPAMSIRDNVVAGLKLNGVRDNKLLDEACEKSLRGANLWDEVKDRLERSGASLSGGQQQRLCIARTIAEVVGKADKAEEVIMSCEKSIADALAAHPDVKGLTAGMFYFDVKKLSEISVYTKGDSRADYLTDLGFKAPSCRR